jgi:hypothetical protein
MFILLGLRYDMWLVLIGLFIYSGADSEKQQAILQASFVPMQPDGATAGRFTGLERDDETLRQ